MGCIGSRAGGIAATIDGGHYGLIILNPLGERAPPNSAYVVTQGIILD